MASAKHSGELSVALWGYGIDCGFDMLHVHRIWNCRVNLLENDVQFLALEGKS